MLRQTTIKQGRIRGVACEDPRVTVYKGVPYAEPPVGDLRWKAPVPAKPWTGEFCADQFPPVPYQDLPEEGSSEFYAREHNPCSDDCVCSEDCLYLNVWTPARTADEALPVYVWFHGGGLDGCFSWQLEIDGESVARKGIVFVSVEYRLNVFGFIAQPEQSDEPAACQANYGLYDCKLALEWIQENIRAFGGDPSKVTIGGQSAGANIVLSMLTSPLTKGLFSQVITESGGGLRAYGYRVRSTPMDVARAKTALFLKELGAASLDEAKSLPTSVVYEAYKRFKGKNGNWGIVIDGSLIPEEPTDVMVRGEHPDVPYLLGANKREGMGAPTAKPLPKSVHEFKEYIDEIFADQADEFFAMCDTDTLENLHRTCRSDAFNTRMVGMRAYAVRAAELGRQSYFYVFDCPIPGDDKGSFHDSEMWFTFGGLRRSWRPFVGLHYDMARQISSYWANFIKTGNPNGVDCCGFELPEWKCNSAEEPFVMKFTTECRKEEEEMDPLMEFRIRYHLSKRR